MYVFNIHFIYILFIFLFDIYIYIYTIYYIIVFYLKANMGSIIYLIITEKQMLIFILDHLYMFIYFVL